MASKNSLNSAKKLKVGEAEHTYYAITEIPGAATLPVPGGTTLNSSNAPWPQRKNL